MAARSAASFGSRFARAAEASREARENRLRRAGWEPGQPYPGVDEQGGEAEQGRASDFSSDFSTEFN